MSWVIYLTMPTPQPETDVSYSDDGLEPEPVSQNW